MPRVDLFSMIHKAVRALLFELSGDVARLDLTSTCAIDGISAKLEHVGQMLDEHAQLEDLYIHPVIAELDPELAASWSGEHRALDVLQIEAARAAEELALADLAARDAAGAKLSLVVNHMLAVQLMHMNREEIELNALLWERLPDPVLGEIRATLMSALPRARHQEWMRLIEPLLSPVERRQALLRAAAVG